LTSLHARRPEDCSVVVNHRQLGRVRGSFRHHEPYLFVGRNRSRFLPRRGKTPPGPPPPAGLAAVVARGEVYMLETHPDQLRCWSTETHVWSVISTLHRRKLCYSVRLPMRVCTRLATFRWSCSSIRI